MSTSPNNPTINTHILPLSNTNFSTPMDDNFLIVGIAASIGGPVAIETILSAFPANFPGAFLVVQHIGADFFNSFLLSLQQKSRLQVQAAGNGDMIKWGNVYLAPPHFHLKIMKTGRLYLEDSPQIAESKPSATALFHSMACIAHRAVGIVLTGMGSDGAQGLKTLKETGAITIAQSKETCVVFGMGAQSQNVGAIDMFLPLNEIPEKICEIQRQIFQQKNDVFSMPASS